LPSAADLPGAADRGDLPKLLGRSPVARAVDQLLSALPVPGGSGAAVGAGPG
jgi:hypothetical protein